MRYMDSLGARISARRGRKKNEVRASKEAAMLDEIQAEYESEVIPVKAQRPPGEEKQEQGGDG
jgi:hypothetical protein